MRAWVKLRKAAELMEMSRLGAFKRLRRLQEVTGVQFLRRDSESCPWEVNLRALQRHLSGEEEKTQLTNKELLMRVEQLTQRLVGFRALAMKLKRRIDRLEEERLAETG